LEDDPKMRKAKKAIKPTTKIPIPIGNNNLKGEEAITGGFTEAGGWYPGGGGAASSGLGRGATSTGSGGNFGGSGTVETGPGSGN